MYIKLPQSYFKIAILSYLFYLHGFVICFIHRQYLKFNGIQFMKLKQI